jgi:hypothetical protein
LADCHPFVRVSNARRNPHERQLDGTTHGDAALVRRILLSEITAATRLNRNAESSMAMRLSIARPSIEADHGRVRNQNNESGRAAFRVMLPVVVE